MIGKAAKPRCFRVRQSPIPYNNQSNAWNDSKLTKWWFRDVFLSQIRKQTSRQVVLLADNFGSLNTDDPALQNLQVKWFLLPPNSTAVHQPMDQGIIAALKANYKSKLLHIMVKNLENYDQPRQLGAALTAGVRGIDHLDAGTLAHQAWDSLTQATLANCWLADILPPLHTAQLHQNNGRYHQQCTSSAIKDLCTLFKSTTLQSFNETVSSTDLQPIEQHMFGDLQSLCMQSNEDPGGLATPLEEWFTIEDSEIVRLNEIEIVIEEEQQCISNQEFHSHLESASCNLPTHSETDIDANDSVGESSEVNRKDILNCTDLDESFKIVKSLFHLTSSLQEDDTTSMLTNVYRKYLELKKEKVELNSR